MSNDIVSILAYFAAQVPYADIVGGIVHTVSTSEVAKLPVVFHMKQKQVINYYPVVPDSKKKSIIFFDDLGSRVTEMQKGQMHFTSRVRLNCWLNNKLISEQSYYSLRSICLGYMLKVMPENVTNDALQLSLKYHTVRIETTGILPESYNPYDAYTLSEAQKQYLLAPYDKFSIEYFIHYRMSEHCLPEMGESIYMEDDKILPL